MTETDATKRPLEMPENFIPYLEKYRIYKLFKAMLQDLIINQPKDHLKHMKVFLGRHRQAYQDVDRVILLVSPELQIDVKAIVKQMIKDLGVFVITRRCVIDRYEKRDEYVPGCVSPALMAEVTKLMTVRDPVPHAGWLMFDHPCSVREARALQAAGVLPTVTLVLTPTPAAATHAPRHYTAPRTFFQQDFEGLKYAYQATLKEVYVEPSDDTDKIAGRCFNGVVSSAAGQGGLQAVGAPGTHRVLLLGPRGSGRSTQARALAAHFGLVYLHFEELVREARRKNNDIGEKLRKFGLSARLRADIVTARLKQKDCVDHGWVMTGFPTCGADLDVLDTITTPPNRIIFLNADMATCRARLMTGQTSVPGIDVKKLDEELEYYFSDTLAELHAAAGITAVEVNALDTVDKVQVKLQAAVMAHPAFDIEISSQQQLRRARAD